MGDRAQSEVVGTLLLVAVVVLATSVVGVFTVANVTDTAGSRGPYANCHIAYQHHDLTVTHTGGESLDASNVAVRLSSRSGGTKRTTLADASDASGSFQPGQTASLGRLDQQTHVRVYSQNGRLCANTTGPTTDSTTTTTTSSTASTTTTTTSTSTTASTTTTTTTTTASSTTTTSSNEKPNAEIAGPNKTDASSNPSNGANAVGVVGWTATTSDSRMYDVHGLNQPPHTSSNVPNLLTGVTLDGSKSTDPDGTIQRYDWTIVNDGGMSGLDLSRNGDHATLSVGGIVTAATNPTITVKLTVTDNHGATDTTTKTITVRTNKPPTVAVIGWSQGRRASLYPAAFDLDDTDLSYKWRVTDAGTLSASDVNWNTKPNGQLTTLTLDQNATNPGKTYTITVELTVTDPHGASDSATETIKLTGSKQAKPSSNSGGSNPFNPLSGTGPTPLGPFRPPGHTGRPFPPWTSNTPPRGPPAPSNNG